jgi:ABC-2 type transport system ATP-binding protein
MIEALGLIKKFGRFTAVKGIDLHVETGQVYGFLGPNGAGKTTTLQMLAGMIQPSGGSIQVGGFDLSTHALDAKRITSFIPDRPYLYERLTAAELLRFVGGLYGMKGKDCAQRAGELLEMFDLSDWGGGLIETFSHGMKQRLVFAAALLPRPRVLIVDEPTVGLDPKGARLIKQVFRDICTKRQATVLLSTHTMEVAEELCDRISVIHHGEIVGTGTLQELRTAAGGNERGLEEIFLKLTEEKQEAATAPTPEATP